MITILTQNSHGCRNLNLDEFTQWNTKNENEFVWLDLWQPNAEEADKILNKIFRFHHLAIEDCLKYINQNEEVHLPKIDNYGDYLFLVFNGLDIQENVMKYSMFSLSCFIGHNFIITVHNESDKNVITSNISDQTKENILKKGPDYALHIILDSLVDRYYPLMDYVEGEIDKVEDFIFKMESSNRTLIKILNLKRELLRIKRIASYQKEILFKLYSGVYDLISKDESLYYRNVYDHLLRIVDSAESYRDIVTGLLDSYLSIVNNNMNNIMKRLTLIATIILPLNLITGIYGMNFEYIPFLHSELGFWISLGVMLAIIIVMLVIFKKAGWITLNSFKELPIRRKKRSDLSI
jgi:magnesium transporter